MDAALMATAREIVRENLDYPALLDQITDEEDLVNAGVNSGEIIRVALGCERRLDRPLSDVELSRITSVRSVADLLMQMRQSQDADARVAAAAGPQPSRETEA
ncbi:hypothetical protein Caci_3503 [Catenulispora acidiphila DSM 44928]|uniref:Carrier domain-containing protein n=1 Tax=Catenulispora acidiphila (strain DSM 44928 / JCM 14897 / NBRC 102108 / NRRL B-24433 / ID139908) TaxID=479433 RepID=C7Q989_CATAD|nr:phosphopantetheine-binding protein [Catenulispora acidiphila]ACU72409.1 hypothetical protein Caci_3503 [Catenulispora acidiphila DSM 44928]